MESPQFYTLEAKATVSTGVSASCIINSPIDGYLIAVRAYGPTGPLKCSVYVSLLGQPYYLSAKGKMGSLDALLFNWQGAFPVSSGQRVQCDVLGDASGALTFQCLFCTVPGVSMEGVLGHQDREHCNPSIKPNLTTAAGAGAIVATQRPAYANELFIVSAFYIRHTIGAPVNVTIVITDGTNTLTFVMAAVVDSTDTLIPTTAINYPCILGRDVYMTATATATGVGQTIVIKSLMTYAWTDA